MNQSTPFNSPYISPRKESSPSVSELRLAQSSGILSDSEILRERKLGNIVIEPFVPEQLGNCSYNITLGPHFYVTTNNKGIHNPWSENDSKKLWKYEHHEDHINIPPGQMVLAHTQEFIGGLHHITTMMKSRSSMGRNFIDITCGSSGWGDTYYFNRWTMEIINHHPTLTIQLPVGKQVGQIAFLYTGVSDKPYRGKYQSTLDLETLMSTWNHSSMLPRLFLENKNDTE
jgi:deoxycytidine triphosphate deaminase